MSSLAAQFSAESSEHYTPSGVSGLAREVLGKIDVDPFSSDLANSVVRAEIIFTKDDNGFEAEWGDGDQALFVNPPGDKICRRPARAEKALVKPGATHAWWKLLDEYEEGRVRQAVFVAFNPDLFQTAQRFGYDPPCAFPFCVPSKRLHYWGVTVPEGSGSAPRSSAVVYLPPRDSKGGWDARAVARFREAFAPLGRVVVPA